MMPGTRLLVFAECLCGNDQRRTIFEPLVADWDREMRDATGTSWQRLQQSGTPVLAVLFGIIGWNLAGLVSPTLTRAIVWWGVAWFATLAVDGRLASLFKVANFERLPWWALPAAIASTALALVIASSRRHRDTGILAPTP